MSKEVTAASVKKPGVGIDSKYIYKLAGTLLGICVVVALLLGIVNSITEPIIGRMQAEKTVQAMSQVLQADDYTPVAVTGENVVALYEAFNGDKSAGYVVEVTSSGFGGPMTMVVGVDPDGAVTGICVTVSEETANVGTKVVKNQSVLDRFIGMSHQSGEITVNSGSNRFDGITGATVTSRGVAAGVNAALAAVAAYNG